MIMSWVLDAILVAATVVALALHLPQIMHTYQTRDVSSFHTGTILLRIVANLLYAAYSLLAQVWILFGASMMIAGFEALLLSMCLAWRPPLQSSPPPPRGPTMGNPTLVVNSSTGCGGTPRGSESIQTVSSGHEPACPA